MIFALFAATLAWSGASQDVVRPSTPEEAAAVVAAFVPNVPPTEGDWRVLDASPTSTMAMDVAHIGEQGSLRTVWIAYAGRFTGGPPGAYALSRLELDCAAGTARPVWFTIRAASGAHLYGFTPSEGFMAYEAGSGGALIAARACREAVLDGPGYATHQAFAAAIADAS